MKPETASDTAPQPENSIQGSSSSGTQPESPASPAGIVQTQEADRQNRLYTIICYCLYAAVILGFYPAVIGVILAYVKRDDLQGTVYHSHMQHLIQTFWIGLIGAITVFVLFYIFIGMLILPFLVIWYTYRLVSGFVRLMDGKAVNGETWI